MLVLAHSDKALAATISTASSMSSVYPITQLNRKYVNATARTATSTTTMAIKVNLAAGDTFNYFAIVNHNLTSANGTARLQVYDSDARTTQVGDSGVKSIDAFSDALETISHGWDYAGSVDRYLTVTLTDTSLSYIEVGAVLIMTRFVPDTNMNFGLKNLADDPFTVKMESDNGEAFYDDRKKQRKAAMNFEYQLDPSGQELYEIYLRMGISGWLFFQYDADDYKSGLFTYLATFEKPSPIIRATAPRDHFAINLVEQL